MIIPICIAYFLPTIMAAFFNYRAVPAVFVVNAAFGWTVYGWLIAMWAALRSLLVEKKWFAGEPTEPDYIL